MRSTELFRYFIVAFLIALSFADESCLVPDEEISKINDILHKIDETVYSDDLYESDNEECDRLINNIHMQLRRLTQRYKLMHKGYEEAEAQRKMVEDYDQQVRKLTKEFEDLKKKATAESSAKLTQLEKETEKLENSSSTLKTQLKGVVMDYEKVKKDLCLIFIQSNQMTSAKQKVKEMRSTFLLELVDQALKGCGRNVMPVIDFCSAIPDLDDRGAAYKRIHEFITTKEDLGEDSPVLLEAAVLKMNATLQKESQITIERRNELRDILNQLSSKTKSIFDKWIISTNKSENQQTIKAALDQLFLKQMKYLGEKVSRIDEYYMVRNFLRLLVVSNNYNKLAAYKELASKRVLSSLGTIMFDMINMQHSELEQDQHVPGIIPQIFNETMDLLPDSLKKLRSCQDNVYIRNAKSNEWVFATNDKEIVKHEIFGNELGDFKRVITDPSKRTKFRLKLTSDRASLRIVSDQGDPLDNFNSRIPKDFYTGFVGAPYTNRPRMKLDHSTEWLLEPNYANDTIKIRSEFNAYQTGHSVDHLIVKVYKNIKYLFVHRFGTRGLELSSEKEYADWKIECASQ